MFDLMILDGLVTNVQATSEGLISCGTVAMFVLHISSHPVIGFTDGLPQLCIPYSTY